MALSLLSGSLDAPPFELSVSPLLAQAAMSPQLGALVRPSLVVLTTIIKAHISVINRCAGLRHRNLAPVLPLTFFNLGKFAFEFVLVGRGQMQVAQLDL